MILIVHPTNWLLQLFSRMPRVTSVGLPRALAISPIPSTSLVHLQMLRHRSFETLTNPQPSYIHATACFVSLSPWWTAPLKIKSNSRNLFSIFFFPLSIKPSYIKIYTLSGLVTLQGHFIDVRREGPRPYVVR